MWPLLLAMCCRYGRQWLAVVAAAAGIAGGLALMMLAYHDHIAALYTYPFSWSIALVIGAATRLGQAYLVRIPAWLRSLAAVAAGTALAVAALLPEMKANRLLYLAFGPGVALCTAVVILAIFSITASPTWLQPLVGLGTISYAAYLWNYPIANWLGQTELPKAAIGVLSIVATLGTATLSWFCVEKPCSAFGRRLDAKPAQAQPVLGRA